MTDIVQTTIHSIFVNVGVSKEFEIEICSGPVFTKQTDVLAQDLMDTRSRKIRI